MRIARTLGAAGRGTIEVAIGPTFGIDDAVRLARLSGHAVTWSGSALVPMAGEHGMDAAMAAVDASTTPGAAVYPQFPVRPIVNLVTLRDPFPLRAASDGFIEALGAAPDERLALYSDQAWRDRTRATLTPLWRERLADATVAETVAHARLRHGPTLGELAEQQGTTPFDVLVDLSLAERLDTRFQMTMANNDVAVIEALLRDERCFVGLSDAGAHVSQLCDANYATYLLGYWVRERGALPLELAVWRLTGQPAAVYGLHDRGRIEVGRRGRSRGLRPRDGGDGRGGAGLGLPGWHGPPRRGEHRHRVRVGERGPLPVGGERRPGCRRRGDCSGGSRPASGHVSAYVAARVRRVHGWNRPWLRSNITLLSVVRRQSARSRMGRISVTSISPFANRAIVARTTS